MLARMFWGTYAVRIEVQMGNCLIVEGSKLLARMVWGKSVNGLCYTHMALSHY